MVELQQAEANYTVSADEFVIDSGTTHNFLNSLKYMVTYEPFEEPRDVRLGGGQPLIALGAGTARIPISASGKIFNLVLNDTMYVPQMRRNLVSVGKLADHGYGIDVSKEAITIEFNGNTVAAVRDNGLFVIRSKEPHESNMASTKKRVSLLKTHQTMAHINIEFIRKMLLRENYDILEDFIECDVCTRGKLHRASYRPKPASAIASRLGYIHADTCAVTPASYGGAKYFLTLTDDLSRYRKVYPVQAKDQIPDKI